MAIRGLNDIVRQVRDLLLSMDELKSVQRVGTNQIVAKPYSTPAAYDRQMTVTAPFQSAGSSFKVVKITVAPENLLPGNILLSDIIPDLRYTSGTRISNWNFSNNTINYATRYFLVLIDSEDAAKNTYLLGIIAPTNTVVRLKVYITANADVTFNLQELN